MLQTCLGASEKLRKTTVGFITPVSPSVCLSASLSVCLSVRLSACPSVCLSVCLSVRLDWTNFYEILYLSFLSQIY